MQCPEALDSRCAPGKELLRERGHAPKFVQRHRHTSHRQDDEHWHTECRGTLYDFGSWQPRAVTTSQLLRAETVGTLQPIKREPQLTPEPTNGPLLLPTPSLCLPPRLTHEADWQRAPRHYR